MDIKVISDPLTVNHFTFSFNLNISFYAELPKWEVCTLYCNLCSKHVSACTIYIIKEGVYSLRVSCWGLFANNALCFGLITRWRMPVPVKLWKFILNVHSATAIQSDSSLLDSASKAKPCAPITAMCPDVQGTASMEMLVGSQKRKARKTKITHLVRTADGSVSPVEGEWRLIDWFISYCGIKIYLLSFVQSQNSTL